MKKIFLTNQKTIVIIPLVKNVKRKKFVLHKKQTLPLSGSEAERTAGSNADAGYKLARSFRCISLIEFKAQFHRVSLVRHDAQQLVKWSIRVVKVSLYCIDSDNLSLSPNAF